MRRSCQWRCRLQKKNVNGGGLGWWINGLAGAPMNKHRGLSCTTLHHLIENWAGNLKGNLQYILRLIKIISPDHNYAAH